MQNQWMTDESQKLYEQYYLELISYTDAEIIAIWKLNQQHMLLHKKTSSSLIKSTVCEDLLRQRGNTYIDDHYPMD